MASYLSSLFGLIREFYNRTIYFILGVIVAISTIYFMNQSNKLKKKNKLKSQGAVDSDDIEYVRFYINIFIMNKSEVIKSKVQSKFKNFKLLGKIAGKIAGRMVTDKQFIQKISDKISLIIPERLQEDIGVVSEVELAFQHESYMVMSVSILSADARKVIEKKGGSEKLKKFDQFMDVLGGGEMFAKPISDQLVSVIGEKLLEQLPIKITERMKEAVGLEVEVFARSEADQARFLFSALKQLASSANQESDE